jgi:hypothetical protein
MSGPPTLFYYSPVLNHMMPLNSTALVQVRPTGKKRSGSRNLELLPLNMEVLKEAMAVR